MAQKTGRGEWIATEPAQPAAPTPKWLNRPISAQSDRRKHREEVDEEEAVVAPCLKKRAH
jgi:hypothetical protein